MLINGNKALMKKVFTVHDNGTSDNGIMIPGEDISISIGEVAPDWSNDSGIPDKVDLSHMLVQITSVTFS